MLAKVNNYRLIELKNLLWTDIDNWLRYGKQKDLPSGYTCLLGDIYKTPAGNVFDADHSDVVRAHVPPIDPIAAKKFDELVVKLPRAQRDAFMLFWLDKLVDGNSVKYAKQPEQKWEFMKCGRSHYYQLLQAAHKSIAIELGLLGEVALVGWV